MKKMNGKDFLIIFIACFLTTLYKRRNERKNWIEMIAFSSVASIITFVIVFLIR